MTKRVDLPRGHICVATSSLLVESLPRSFDALANSHNYWLIQHAFNSGEHLQWAARVELLAAGCIQYPTNQADTVAPTTTWPAAHTRTVQTPLQRSGGKGADVGQKPTVPPCQPSFPIERATRPSCSLVERTPSHHAALRLGVVRSRAPGQAEREPRAGLI